jgi:transcription antitermination factor NusG
MYYPEGDEGLRIFRSDHLNSGPIGIRAPQANFFPRWYALRTRSRHEKVVDRVLRNYGFKTFLPLRIKSSRLSLRRARETELPLFPGYTFAQFAPSPENLRMVRASVGLAGIVGSSSRPVSIPDAEIETVKQVLAAELAFFPGDRFPVGQRVIVTSGPLRGVCGEIARRKKREVFLVKIRLIQRCLEVELSLSDLRSVVPLAC